MRLRGRFTLWFAIAALVPIAIAALVTREVLARSYRNEYQRSRAAAEQAARSELRRLETDVKAKVGGLASKSYPFIGGLLGDLAKGDGQLDGEARRRLKEQAGEQQSVLGLAVLTVLARDGEILAAPHDRAAVGERAHLPRVAEDVVYKFEKITGEKSMESILVGELARVASDGPISVTVVGGRRVDRELLDSVRRPGQIDARLVDANGVVLVAPLEEWRPTTPLVRIALDGEGGAGGGKPAASIELAVSDRGLPALQRQVTLIAVGLAVAVLAVTTLIGALVARRITRGLDRVVAGAQAAARGDLDHRVAVTSKDEVGEVAAAFNLMMEDLRTAEERLVIAERIAAWQEIARRLAHEIKNPLTPIQMAMDNLRKTWRKQHPSFPEILEESTKTVLEEADRLRRIVTEFSDFARMPKPDLAPLDLGEVVSSALALYQGETPVEHKATAVPAIEADRGQMNQVLLNLVENARDAIAGKEGGKITVTTRPGEAGDRVELIVEDNGPGVPMELRDRVFTPYFTTKQGRGGTGLGLAIVHRIISDHGGRVVVGSVPTGGARLTVELPIKPGQLLLASRV
ncbi:MAG TPA: ATP-binding protein [Kofleriaceae bacterium]|nr:ATP-binding protein [Kofleriaceae bacterium]